MKNFVKKTFITLSMLLGFIFLIFSTYFLISLAKYSSLALNSELLTTASLNIEIFDDNHRPIEEDNSFNGKYIKLQELPSYVKECFISIEDKDFYKHNGINKKRIIKATINNLKNLSYKEGASTISQQLIKNTHLSGEKTISRKLKEISLTKKLEKRFSKDEILEFYLNVIYFGNNTYGINEASNYYFSKDASLLSLPESAMLAGMIKSPKKYSPITNPESSKSRRNLVLSEMAKDGKISFSDEIKFKQEDLNLKINCSKVDKLNTYSEQAIDEATSLLKMPAKQIAIGEYKIYTYQNSELQNNLINSISQVSFDENDFAGMAIDSKTGGIQAYYGNSVYKILEYKRQPGSLIKPILVYAPAINENIISPSTLILDEKINIGDFSPKNVDGKYNGYISCRESLAKSINIPTVKILSYVGIEKAKNYAVNAGIEFEKTDDSYALALGGMTYGTTLKQITNAYMPLANSGKFTTAKFIHFITDKNGKIVYKNDPVYKQVFRDDTSFLVTDMLKDATNIGTAKKLGSLKKTLASKTGTVGIKGKKENLDAWNITYTPDLIVGIWTGNLDNKPISISGGNQPTIASKNFFSNLDVNDFEMPSSVEKKEIDLIELDENHKIMLANSATPERYKKEELFSRFNSPIEQSSNFILPPKINAEIISYSNKKILELKTKEYCQYKIYDNENNLLKEIKNNKNKAEIELECDKTYFVECSYLDGSMPVKKELNLKSGKKMINHKKQKKWYI